MDRFWAWPPEGAAISTEVCFSESFGDFAFFGRCRHCFVCVQTHQLLFLCNRGGTMQPLLCSSLLPASSFVAYGFQLLPTSGLNVQPSLLYSTGRPANSVVAVRALFGVGSKPKAVRQVVKIPLLFSVFWESSLAVWCVKKWEYSPSFHAPCRESSPCSVLIEDLALGFCVLYLACRQVKAVLSAKTKVQWNVRAAR